MKNPEYESRLEKLERELAELKLSRVKKAIRAFRRNRRAIVGTVFCLGFVPLAIHAFTVPNSFTAGTPAVAADMNANFTAIKNQFDAMEGKSWRLIYEMDLGSATTSFTATGLNGDTDIEYMFLVKAINSTGGSVEYFMNPNGDTTSANYGFNQVYGQSNTALSSTVSPWGGLYIGNSTSGAMCISHSTMLAKSGTERINLGIYLPAVSGTSIPAHSSFSSIWSQTGAITSILFRSTQTNGFGAGSHVEIWARR